MEVTPSSGPGWSPPVSRSRSSPACTLPGRPAGLCAADPRGVEPQVRGVLVAGGDFCPEFKGV